MSSPAEEPYPYPSRAIIGSRRLTGANLYSHRPGAVLEIALQPQNVGLLGRWHELMREILPRLKWEDEVTVVRHNASKTFGGLFLSAPLDGLLTATEVNEQVWVAAEELANERPVDFEDLAARLRVFQQHERQPRMMALVHEARARGLSVTCDDESLSVGTGTGSDTWPLASIPDVAAVSWDERHDIPVVLVTGSNGKTTTTRLLAAMLQKSGHVAGWSCTDGLWVNGECTAPGDYSGPAGARAILHDRRVTAAVLETARGGILRRGLAVDRADVAIVTNISNDHLGEYGIDDLEALGVVKLVVARAIPPTGHVVLNADDALLRRLAAHVVAPIMWLSCDPTYVEVRSLLSRTQNFAVLDNGRVLIHLNGHRHDVGPVAEMPITVGGTLRYNIANVLAAASAACSLGISADDVRQVLATFGSHPSHNPGRFVQLALNGARVVVDFVHNPDGWRVMGDAFRGVPGRRLVVLGQAGDRDDAALQELARSVAQFKPDLIVLKEMVKYLRGRTHGEVTRVLAREFASLGVGEHQLYRAPDELSAVQQVAALARSGDLVIVGAHEDVDAVINILRNVGAVDYPPG
ncbi:MAG: Mur ligase family protein [Gemmatimonadaceae bacterium]